MIFHQRAFPFRMGVCLLIFLLNTLFAGGQKVSIQSVKANSHEVEVYGKFELTVELTANFKNPYDYNEMGLQAVFLALNGKRDTVDAFYVEPYKRDLSSNIAVKTGVPTYKIRYAPQSTGLYKYWLLNNGRQSDEGHFTSLRDDKAPGFIRKNRTNYLQYSNGKQFIVIGENVNCPAENVFSDYTRWMDKLSANGANLMNVWMIYAGFGIEWTDLNNKAFGGLKKYNQQNAAHLDWLLDECDKKELYLLLGLNTSGGESSTVNPPWSQNPYNAKNGGPCQTQGEFFKNNEAKAILKNRLKYIVARYGYSKNIMAWNLFIEADGIKDYKNYKKDVVEWNGEMSAYLKNIDVNHHLVTTSYSSKVENENTWKLPGIDFTQTHSYVKTELPEKRIVQANRAYLDKFKKPTLTAEFGIDPANVDLNNLDPHGIYFHNVLWSSVMGGAMGTALTYWWHNYIDPQNLYYHFKTLAAFVSRIPLKDENYQPARAIIRGSANDISIRPNAGWFAQTDTEFMVDQLGNISPSEDRLGIYLYGKLLNTQWRTPVIFAVNFMNKGYLSVSVGDATLYPALSVSIDGKKPVERKVVKNTTYRFAIPAGTHTIKVENSGNDWFWVNEYSFSNAGANINAYVLINELKSKAAGYLLNQQYNWKARLVKETLDKQNGTLVIPGMQKGNYSITFYDPATLKKITSFNQAFSTGDLTIQLPVISWDAAFTAEKLE